MTDQKKEDHDIEVENRSDLDVNDEEDFFAPPLKFMQEAFGDLDFLTDVMPRLSLVDKEEQTFVASVMIRDTRLKEIIFDRSINLSGIINLVDDIISHTLAGLEIADQFRSRISIPASQHQLHVASGLQEKAMRFAQLVEKLIIKDEQS